MHAHRVLTAETQAAAARRGPPALDHALVARGSAEVDGLAGTFEVLWHADGRASAELASPLPSAAGFDGRSGWAVDPSGLRGPFELEDLERFRVLHEVWSGRWLWPDGSLEIEEPPAASGHGALRWAVRIRGGRYRFHVTTDRSLLPRRIDEDRRSDSFTTLDEPRQGPWGPIAHRLVHHQGWLNDSWRIHETAVVHGDRDDLFAGPASRPSAAGCFAAGVSPEVETRTTRRGRLPLVRVAIEGKDAGFFLLDTGAGTTAIGERAAQDLGLPARGRTWVQTSDGGLGAPYRFAPSLTVGPLSIEALPLLELDTEALSRAAGTAIAGVCGFDCFARARVRIEDGGRIVSLHPPDGLEEPHGTWLPMSFEGRRPLIRASVAGCGDDLYAIDTGSSATAVLYDSIVRRGQLLDTATRPSAARGVAGEERWRERTLPWIELGAHRIERPRVLLSAAVGGLATQPGKAGALGWGALRRYDVTFDYPRRRVALVPRTSP